MNYYIVRDLLDLFATIFFSLKYKILVTNISPEILAEKKNYIIQSPSPKNLHSL